MDLNQLPVSAAHHDRVRAATSPHLYHRAALEGARRPERTAARSLRGRSRRLGWERLAAALRIATAPRG
jgi:hypothetical protein